LRPAFSRQVSFMWFATVVAGLMVRPELRGVTSMIRALNLRPKLYDPLRKHFHSSAIKLDQLAALWTQAVLSPCPTSPRACGFALMAACLMRYYRPRYRLTKPKERGSNGSWRRSRTTSKLIDRKGGGYGQTAIIARCGHGDVEGVGRVQTIRQQGGVEEAVT
jgi:hypothetical protein